MDSLVTLLPFALLIGVMFLMTRSAKKKQQQAAEMRDSMHPGTGVRTIGGMYALVKSVNDDTVELEIAPGVHVHYAKNAVAAVLDPAEYAAIIDGVPADDFDAETDDDDTEKAAGEAHEAPTGSIDLGKAPGADADAADDAKKRGPGADA